jgi:exopolysaccharide biosynthesis WecB/TagA/CpsF family protein
MKITREDRVVDFLARTFDHSKALEGSETAAVDFVEIKLIGLNGEDATKFITEAIAHPKALPFLLIHVNVHSLRSLLPGSELWEKLQARACLLLEGVGLKIACLLTKGWIAADTNGTDLFPVLLDQLCRGPCRLFLLGSRPDALALAKQKIEESWPHVEVVGWRDGYFSKEEIPSIRDQIFRARPTLLLIGMGSPEQEALALEFLQVEGLQLVWTVGGLFDRISGKIVRAPRLVRKFRFEWLFRISIEPRRLTLRYLFDAFWLARFVVQQWLNW